MEIVAYLEVAQEFENSELGLERESAVAGGIFGRGTLVAGASATVLAGALIAPITCSTFGRFSSRMAR